MRYTIVKMQDKTQQNFTVKVQIKKRDLSVRDVLDVELQEVLTLLCVVILRAFSDHPPWARLRIVAEQGVFLSPFPGARHLLLLAFGLEQEALRLGLGVCADLGNVWLLTDHRQILEEQLQINKIFEKQVIAEIRKIFT